MHENLFHWPLCFDSFKEEEVHANNWPYPRYENGDIFPTWGYLGIRAYIGYNKETALKYIKNLLEQYNKDGLSSQRYSRITQEGLGSDILAGICTSITALYRDIYGIRPKWNRFGLEPNTTASLNGTDFNYTLRDVVYNIKLNDNDYSLRTDGFCIQSKSSFGANKTGKRLSFYPNNEEAGLFVTDASSNKPICLRIDKWETDEYAWTLSSKDHYKFTITGLQPGQTYRLKTGDQIRDILSDADGSITFKQNCDTERTFSLKKS